MNDLNPWSGINKPSTSIPVFDKGTNQTFWWHKTEQNNLALQFSLEMSNTTIPDENKFPNLRLIKFKPFNSVGGKRYLFIELLDSAQRNIFCEFCWVLINACTDIEDEQEAVDRLFARSWRWHSLLARGFTTILSEEKQKGLIGELYFLSNILFEHIGPKKSLQAWEGPTDSPKDFDLTPVHVEIKAKRPTSRPAISISSENQLEIISGCRLFLAVFGIYKSSKESSMTLTDWYESIEEKLHTFDPTLLDRFYMLMNDSGFNFQDDYSEFSWEIQEIIYYEILDDFPRLVSTKIPLGIEYVKYSLDMNQLKDFEIKKESILALLS